MNSTQTIKWSAVAAIALVLIGGLLYLISPYASLYQMGKGFSEADRERLETYIVWDTFRESLKDELGEIRDNKTANEAGGEWAGRGAQLANRMGERITNRMVDTFTDLDTLMPLLEKNKAAKEGGDGEPANRFGDNWDLRLSWLFFRSFNEFVAEFTNPETPEQVVVLLFERAGRIWQLTHISLPDDYEFELPTDMLEGMSDYAPEGLRGGERGERRSRGRRRDNQ